MCRFTTLQEYKAKGHQAKTWCLCKGQKDATWECVRYWLEQKLLPRMAEEASPSKESTRIQFQSQFVPFHPHTSVKDPLCWYAVTVSEFEQHKRDLSKCYALYADVVVNALNETILYMCFPYNNNPPNLETYIKTSEPPCLVKSYVSSQELKQPHSKEEEHLQHIMAYTFHKFADVPDYLMLAQTHEVTTYAHPSDFYTEKLQGLRSEAGEQMSFFPIIKRNRKHEPSGIPRSSLEVVTTEAEAEFVEWTKPPPGSHERATAIYTRRIR